MNRGVLGGTFDPIHNGHLAVAEKVLVRLDLDEILFVPSGQPWLKPVNPSASAQDRLEMVRLSLAGKPYFKISTIEVEKNGPSYSVDTISRLKDQQSRDELYFIIGWDNLSDLPRWKEPTRLISLCRLVAVPRPGYPSPDLVSLDAKVPGLSERVILMEEPVIDISSSVIRDRVALGLSIHGVVPETVERYIREHRLYIRIR